MNEQYIGVAVCIVMLIVVAAYVAIYVLRPQWLYWLGDVPPPVTDEEKSKGVRDDA